MHKITNIVLFFFHIYIILFIFPNVTPKRFTEIPTRSKYFILEAKLKWWPKQNWQLWFSWVFTNNLMRLLDHWWYGFLINEAREYFMGSYISDSSLVYVDREE